MSSKRHINRSNSKPDCSCDVENHVFLRISGLTVDNEERLEYLDLSRDAVIIAKDDILIFQLQPRGAEYRFRNTVIVVSPEMKMCSNSQCKSMIYVEDSIIVNSDYSQTVQLQVCDLIAADEGVVYFIRTSSCDCKDHIDGIQHPNGRLEPNLKDGDAEFFITSNQSFLIHSSHHIVIPKSIVTS